MIQVDSITFANEVLAFFKDRPEEVNGLGTIRLLLFIEPISGTYTWYALAKWESIENVLQIGMAKKRYVPIGACFLSFEKRANDRVYLVEEAPVFVNENFDAEEVLNGTIPYFMKEKFNYTLGQIKISDLSKN